MEFDDVIRRWNVYFNMARRDAFGNECVNIHVCTYIWWYIFHFITLLSDTRDLYSIINFSICQIEAITNDTDHSKLTKFENT